MGDPTRQMHERILQGQNFYRFRDDGPLSSIPYPVRLVVGGLVARGVTKQLHAQGLGRHSVEELDQMSEEGFAALNDFYTARTSKSSNSQEGSIPWIFGGDHPSEADASLYGLLVSALVSA